MFQLRKAINDSVYRNIDEHFLDNFNLLDNGNVVFGDFEISVNARKSLGIFSPSTQYNYLKIFKNGNQINLNDYFKNELIESYSEEGRKKILNNQDGKYTEFINFLSQIDRKLNTKFLSDSGL